MRPPIALIIVASLAATAVLGAQKEQLFPHTKKQGKATSEYRHEGFHVVVNYDYSQKNHSGPWLLIDVAMASKTRFVLHRDNFSIVLADGRAVKLATQDNLTNDGPGLWSLSQNSKIHRRNLDTYFVSRGHEPIKFYSFPFERAVSDEAIVDNDRVTLGALLFKSPEGSWKAGTYKLEIDNEKAKAALPIALQ